MDTINNEYRRNAAICDIPYDAEHDHLIACEEFRKIANNLYYEMKRKRMRTVVTFFSFSRSLVGVQ